MRDIFDIADGQPIVMGRYLDLREEALAHMGWPMHPEGRYISLEDLKFVFDTYGTDELVQFLDVVEAAPPMEIQ